MVGSFAAETTALAPAQPSFEGVPGVVIHHSPAASGLYIGSPSLAVLLDGRYVATHDLFGPNSAEHQQPRTLVFASADRGRTWRQVGEVSGQFWSSLFVHRGALYLLGTDKHHGNIVIRRSLDGGVTWTSPTDPSHGLLRADGQYHCAPVPVLEHGRRLWRAFERRDPPVGWGITYCAGMASVPVDADLLQANAWTFSNFLPGSATWLSNGFGGWLEGNAVVGPKGGLLDILRVDTTGYPERAALVQVSSDGRTVTFDPASGFIPFPGGAKKFTIRFDPVTARYWALSSWVPPQYQSRAKPGTVRNTLALVWSSDLRGWTVQCVLLHHPDAAKHGFQYVDWQFEGPDLIAVCRTAYDDGLGGARNYHDANFLTFHRIERFRDKTPADSVPIGPGPAPKLQAQPPAK